MEEILKKEIIQISPAQDFIAVYFDADTLRPELYTRRIMSWALIRVSRIIKDQIETSNEVDGLVGTALGPTPASESPNFLWLLHASEFTYPEVQDSLLEKAREILAFREENKKDKEENIE